MFLKCKSCCLLLLVCLLKLNTFFPRAISVRKHFSTFYYVLDIFSVRSFWNRVVFCFSHTFQIHFTHSMHLYKISYFHIHASGPSFVRNQDIAETTPLIILYTISSACICAMFGYEMVSYDGTNYSNIHRFLWALDLFVLIIWLCEDFVTESHCHGCIRWFWFTVA